MKIRLIEQTNEIYERDDIAEVLEMCVVACTRGKLQSIAQSVYGKTQGRFYVLEVDGQAVGVLGGTEIDRYQFVIKHIAVRKQSQKHGFAKSLIDFARQDRQYKKMVIEVDESAMRFFKGYGFTCKRIKDHPLDLVRYNCEWSA